MARVVVGEAVPSRPRVLPRVGRNSAATNSLKSFTWATKNARPRSRDRAASSLKQARVGLHARAATGAVVITGADPVASKCSIVVRASSRAPSRSPLCACSAPQQHTRPARDPSVSKPVPVWRAPLMSCGRRGASPRIAQPSSIATSPRRGPTAGVVAGSGARSDFGGTGLISTSGRPSRPRSRAAPVRCASRIDVAVSESHARLRSTVPNPIRAPGARE